MGDVSSIWQIAYGIGCVIAALAVTVYVSRKNSTSIGDLYEKVNKKMDEETARETFVTKDVNEVQIKHIDKTLEEIKQGQDKILDCLIDNKSS